MKSRIKSEQNRTEQNKEKKRKLHSHLPSEKSIGLRICNITSVNVFFGRDTDRHTHTHTPRIRCYYFIFGYSFIVFAGICLYLRKPAADRPNRVFDLGRQVWWFGMSLIYPHQTQPHFDIFQWNDCIVTLLIPVSAHFMWIRGNCEI